MATRSYDGVGGGEWLLTHSSMICDEKTGAKLKDRIIQFGHAVAWARARLAEKFGSNNEDYKTLTTIIEQIAGKPCPEGGCTREGLLHLYDYGMDNPVELEYNKDESENIEKSLIWLFCDFADIVNRNNLVSREAIEGVEMQSSGRQRYKEA